MAARDGDPKTSRQDVMASASDMFVPHVEARAFRELYTDRRAAGSGCGSSASRRPSIGDGLRAGLRRSGPGYRAHAIDRRQRKVASRSGHWGGTDRATAPVGNKRRQS
jgi:hypothetical protein